MGNFIDITGNKYGKLTVISLIPDTKPAKWNCLCECGNTKNIIGSAMKNGSTQSCGCLHIERNKELFTKHGEISSKLYAVHQAMLRRCTTVTHKEYKSYGGRGITICSEWYDFLTFKAWAESTGYLEGLTLDREKVDGNYEPRNCRWATRTTQSRNRRIQLNKTSKYVGVSWDKGRSKWFASIGVDNKHIALGRFDSEEEAAQTRDNYIKNNNLKDFVLNFN